LSSAILYLGIVAVWAFVLVPRWVRKPHARPPQADAYPDSFDLGSAEFAAAPDGAVAADNEPADMDQAAFRPLDAPPTRTVPTYGRGEGRLSGARAAATSADDADAGAPVDTADAVPPQRSLPPPNASGAEPAKTAPRWRSRRFARRAEPPAVTGYRSVPDPRARVLRTRRRILLALVLVTVAVAGCADLKIAAWWECVPPAGMLAFYLLLLRVAARTDAERAQQDAEYARAETVRAASTSQSSAQARAEPAEPPSAEVIAIPASAEEQLYDQYEDATMRAVGD
jgi:hypothetical protein